MRKAIIILASSFLCLAPITSHAQKKSAAPHLLIYKTKKNYSNHVAVQLSDDKTKIISYPDPKDVAHSEKRNAPSALHDGYLLDNSGIGLNTAYLKMTKKEYAKLAQAPGPDELMKMILDKDPMVMICDCGNRYAFKKPVSEINKLIDSNKLNSVCKIIKLNSSPKPTPGRHKQN